MKKVMAILGMLTLVLTVNAQSKKEMRAEMREKITAEKKVFLFGSRVNITKDLKSKVFQDILN